jgi:hypothetical protein
MGDRLRGWVALFRDSADLGAVITGWQQFEAQMSKRRFAQAPKALLAKAYKISMVF